MAKHSTIPAALRHLCLGDSCLLMGGATVVSIETQTAWLHHTMAEPEGAKRFSLNAKKWQQPGWRIEQRYSPGVLIGNWAEDRYEVLYHALLCWHSLSLSFSSPLPPSFHPSLPFPSFRPFLPSFQFVRGKEFGNSTSRETFQQYSAASYKPEASTRRKGLLRNDV